MRCDQRRIETGNVRTSYNISISISPEPYVFICGNPCKSVARFAFRARSSIG